MKKLLVTMIFFALFAVTNETSAATYEEKENNNFPSYAKEAFPLNATYTGVLGDKSDKDYYKLTVPEDGELEISFSNVPFSKFNILLKTSASSGQDLTIADLYSDDSKNPKTYKTFKVDVKKGDYFIGIEDEKAATFEPYTIKTKFKANDKILYQMAHEQDSFIKYRYSSFDLYKEIQLNTLYTGRIQNLIEKKKGSFERKTFRFTINEPMTISVNVFTENPNSYKFGIKYIGEVGEIVDERTYRNYINNFTRQSWDHHGLASDRNQLSKSITEEYKISTPGQYAFIYQVGSLVEKFWVQDSDYKIIIKNKLALSFSDVPLSHPYYTEIMTAASKGIINGYPNGKFQPTTLITREQLVNMLARTAIDFTPVRDAVTFTDVPKTYNYYGNIQKLYQAGIIDGNTKNHKFYPTEPITRAELAMILVKAFHLEQKGSAMAFSDVSKSDPAYKYIQILASHGITTGDGKGKFNPKEQVSRQHFTLFMMRIMENTQK